MKGKREKRSSQKTTLHQAKAIFCVLYTIATAHRMYAYTHNLLLRGTVASRRHYLPCFFHPTDRFNLKNV